MKIQTLEFQPQTILDKSHSILKTVEVWTDGGTTHNGKPGSYGGWAFVALGLEKPLIGFSNKIPGECTNNRCEIMGVLAALITIAAPGVSLTIKSDSQYVVKTVNEWRHNWYRKRDQSRIKNKSLFEKLFHLVDSNNVKLEWVKGHAGTLGNEIADTWATHAMNGVNPKDHHLEKANFIFFDSIIGLNDDQ